MAVVAARSCLLAGEAAQLLTFAMHFDERLPAIVLLGQPHIARQLVRPCRDAGILTAPVKSSSYHGGVWINVYLPLKVRVAVLTLACHGAHLRIISNSYSFVTG